MYINTKNITVKQMRKLINRQKEKEREFDSLEKEYKKVCEKYKQQLDYLDFQIQVANTITDFWGNIPVSIEDYKTRYGRNISIISYGDNLRHLRTIDIYPNAHTSENGKAKNWHINIQVYSNGSPLYTGGKAFLYNATSIEELMPIARKFIENEITPEI